MTSRARVLWDTLRSSLWFLPSLMVAAGAALGVALVELSARIDHEALARWPRLFGASADSSRDMLAAIAGSTVTVVGVTFSLTMVAVTQASAQYTPRILRNFMRDRPSQVVLGGLAGVFTYCVVVLRTIRGGDEGSFVPSVAVLVGFVLAVVAVGLLIFFVHHMTSALQASSVIARVTDDSMRAIDRLFPAEVAEPDAWRPAARPLEGNWSDVPAARSGYVQRVDADVLLQAARQHGVVVRLDAAIGDFVATGRPLASVLRPTEKGGEPTAAEVEELREAITGAFTIGHHRTVEQDAAFGVQQLVDIAVKALSPGINDPTTAINCIDYLSAVLARAAARGEEPDWRLDQGILRVIARGPTFEGLVTAGLDEIRRHADGKAAILGRLVDAIRRIAAATQRPAHRAVLARQVALLEEAVARTVPAPSDRVALEESLAAAARELGVVGRTPSP